MFKLIDQTQKTDPLFLESSKKAVQSVLSNKDLGFVQLPERTQLWSKCQQLADAWTKDIKHFVVVGIGGSSLGPQVITEVFQNKRFTYIDNVDPMHFYYQLEGLSDWDKTGWVVTSKSGSTMETLCALEMVLQYSQEKFNSSKLGRCVVISENTNNPLVAWAKSNSYDLLEIPLDVGGRYSVLSPVGMFPAALAGLDLERFRKGAVEALQSVDLISNLISQTVSSFDRNEWITTFWFYSARGFFMGRWIQQLWAESLAKRIDRSGKPSSRASTPMVALGTTDQHSTLQQMMEGACDKFYWFFRFESCENDKRILKAAQVSSMKWLEGHSMGALLKAEAIATQKALEEEGRSALTLYGKALDEQSLGFFFMMMELVVAGIAERLNLNAFDQPGVELGKRLARQQFMTQG